MRQHCWFWAWIAILAATLACNSSDPEKSDGAGTDDGALPGDGPAIPRADGGVPGQEAAVVTPDAAAPRWTMGKGGPIGASSQELTFDSVKRVFAVHVPASYKESQGIPLLLHFHGWRPPPVGIVDEIKYVWASTAEAKGFIAVAPEGLACPELSDRTPAECVANPQLCIMCFRETRDGPFVAALVAALGKKYNLDLARIYLAGHSGGSFFIQGYGLSSPESYAAAAEFAGGCISASPNYGNSCAVYDGICKTAKRKIPFYAIHNPADQIVPIKYSADLIAVLKANGYTTNALEETKNGGSKGHSIDPTITPQVWDWLATFTLP